MKPVAGISCRATADDQFSLTALHRPADKWTGFKDVERRNDRLDPTDGRLRRVLKNVIEDSIKVVPYAL